MEGYFTEAITQYETFNLAAAELLDALDGLSPELLQERCAELTEMQQTLIRNKEIFFKTMEFFGPELLDTSSIGEFQRTLDQSIITCEALQREISSYRQRLVDMSQNESSRPLPGNSNCSS